MSKAHVLSRIDMTPHELLERAIQRVDALYFFFYCVRTVCLSLICSDFCSLFCYDVQLVIWYPSALAENENVLYERRLETVQWLSSDRPAKALHALPPNSAKENSKISGLVHSLASSLSISDSKKMLNQVRPEVEDADRIRIAIV